MISVMIFGELTWQDVKWLQSITKLPVFVKGILTAEDGEIQIASSFEVPHQVRLICLFF
jgi:(S)-2-hydroxy-acid oxidase